MAARNHERAHFELIDQINHFIDSFETDANPSKIISNGLFGYFTHEAVEHFETIKLKQSDDVTRQIPVMQYHIYRYIIAIDHFKNELYIFYNQAEGKPTNGDGIEKLEYLIKNKNFPEYNFKSQMPSNQTSPMRNSSALFEKK